MKPEIAKLWTTALRSGDYKQGKWELEKDGCFCVLGVLCDLASKAGVDVKRRIDRSLPLKDYITYDTYSAVLPESVLKWAGVKESDGSFFNTKTNECQRLYRLNDNGIEFKDLADIIEQNVDVL